MKDGDQIDPASIRMVVAGRTYRIGLRVLTPEGPATVTGFDPGEVADILVTLDSTGEEVSTSWKYAELQPLVCPGGAGIVAP